MTRESIKPTYDHRETGDRYAVATRVNERVLPRVPTRDPFVTHRVTVGLRDLLRGLLRGRVEVEVRVSGDASIIEDVCELDADYTGRADSTRRGEWRDTIQAALSDFARGGLKEAACLKEEK